MEAFFELRAQNASDDELVEDLARHVIGTDFARQLATDGLVTQEETLGFVSGAELRTLGLRILRRISEEVYLVVCGDVRDDDENKRAILSASGLSDAAVLAALSSLIVSTLHVSLAVAAASSGLLLRHVIRPSGEEVCIFWRKSLD